MRFPSFLLSSLGRGQRARGLANWNSTGGAIEDMSIKVGDYRLQTHATRRHRK